ncbi:RnfABCDGE type electron transport complex subunit B, partial [Bordetella pertussis]|uniref:RnfABCDGE type electron transport complex subunit B n=1 Tax=Bordetella pertussis TaxID=520 RepID=UPI0021CB7DE5
MSSCSSLVDRIDALLPQTQCTKCGYDGCRPYAQAIADGAAAINRCPPGDESGVAALAALASRAPAPPATPGPGAARNGRQRTADGRD